MKRITGLCRVSTDRQKEEQTIEVQKDIIKEWALNNNAVIVDWYCDDGWSGDILARPELDRLRDDAGKDLWEAVVCVDRDRIARKLSLQELVINEMEEKEKELIIISDPIAATPEGRIMQQIKGVFAEYEKYKITERMRRGKMKKAKSGKIVGYCAPYGYRYISKKGDQEGYFEIYEPEAQVVRMIFNWVANDGFSMRRVIKELYELGIQPPKNKSERWVKSSIERILKRQDYYGISFYNRRIAVIPKNPQNVSGYKKIKKSSRKWKPEEEWIEVPVPALITKELFDQAQEGLKANVTYNIRNKVYTYLLSGKVECMCGIKRVGDGTNGHHYYRCAQRIYKYPLPNKCSYQGVNAEVLDNTVWNKLVKLLTQPELVKRELAKWKKRHGEDPQTLKEEKEKHQKALKKIDDEGARILQAYREGVITFDVFRGEMDDLKAKKALFFTEQEKEVEKKMQKIRDMGNLREICDTISEVLKKASDADKQVCMRKLIDRVIVGERRKATIKGLIPVYVASENIQDVLKNRNCRTAERR